jgi:hypothetical protein
MKEFFFWILIKNYIYHKNYKKDMKYAINERTEFSLSDDDPLETREENLKEIARYIRKRKANSDLIELILRDLRHYVGSRSMEKVVYISKNTGGWYKLERSYREFVREIAFDEHYKFNRHKVIKKVENIIGFSREDCKRALRFVDVYDDLRFNTRVIYWALWLEFEIIKISWKEILLEFFNRTYNDKSVRYNRERVLFQFFRLNDYAVPKGVQKFKGVEKYLLVYRKSIRGWLDWRGYGMKGEQFKDYIEKLLDRVLGYRKSFSQEFNDFLVNKIYYTKLINKRRRLFFAPRGGYHLYLKPFFEEIKEKLNEIYYDKVIPSYNDSIVHAYTKGKSIVTCARAHKDSRFIVKADISSFFESITKEMIITDLRKYIPEKEAKEIGEFVVYDGKLRLGSPLSPIVSNIVAFPLDKDIKGFIQKEPYNKFGLTYTRYSDDLFFSSESEEEFPFERFIKELRKVVEHYEFSLNEEKVAFLTDKYRKSILSINLNQDNFSIPKRYRRKLRTRIHHFIGSKFDYQFDKKNSKYPDSKKKKRVEIESKRIEGILSYMSSVNPQQTQRIRKYKVRIEDFGGLFEKRKALDDTPHSIIYVINEYLKKGVRFKKILEAYKDTYEKHLGEAIIWKKERFSSDIFKINEENFSESLENIKGCLDLYKIRALEYGHDKGLNEPFIQTLIKLLEETKKKENKKAERRKVIDGLLSLIAHSIEYPFFRTDNILEKLTYVFQLVHKKRIGKPKLAFGYGYDPEDLKKNKISYEYSHTLKDGRKLYLITPELPYRVFHILGKIMGYESTGNELKKGETSIKNDHIVTKEDPKKIVANLNNAISELFEQYDDLPKYESNI